MSSFFTAPLSHKKRKRPDASVRTSTSVKRHVPNSVSKTNGPSKTSTSQSRAKEDDEDSIPESDSDISEDAELEAEEERESSSEDEEETAAERRLKLAERYLENLREELAQNGEAGDPEGFDAADIDREIISQRLREDVAESKGKIYRLIADRLDFGNGWKSKTAFRADQLGLTAIVVAPPYIYTAAKDKSLCKWRLSQLDCSNSKSDLANGEGETAEKQPTNIAIPQKPKFEKKYVCRANCKDAKSHPGHVRAILCLAVSHSGKLLATGGADNRIVIWDAETLKPLKAFANQHRDHVLAVSFRRHNPGKGAQTLYSASADRTIKVWNLDGDGDPDQMTYLETLFGHEDKIVDLVGLAGEKCVSVGARDRSARLWKIVEESQSVFRGGGAGKKVADSGEEAVYAEGSIDRVAMVDEDTFVTGSDSGSISLWSVLRKKPIFTVPLAHGADPPPTIEESYGDEADRERQGRPKSRWITALATVPYSDLILSGSWDGSIRAWRVTEDKKRIEEIGALNSAPASSAVIRFDGEDAHINGNGVNGHLDSQNPRPLRGIINSLSVFERGDRGKDGICILAALSKTHQLGSYVPVKKARCEAVLFNIDRTA